MIYKIKIAVALLVFLPASWAEVANFEAAKKLLKQQVGHDTKTLYCGCAIKKVGKELKPDAKSCGYVPRKPITKSGLPNVRATRIEWEHIVPAWEFGHQLQCWQQGGRANCRKKSEKFRLMEADINNLAPAIGEINGDRSNFRFGMLSQPADQYGQCQVKIDFKQRVVEPPLASRKQIAEAYFYMQKTYQLKISDKQQKLFNVWAGLEANPNLL
ncbi:deoxyribonuclease I [Pseudoalteromonas tunicata]|uniref:Endonuclease I (Endo I) n=1 Tax=Pseudoalteromonas tunicata D2 TaxID=87626 RepID=A4CFU7_9GAMM|nr:deoxyribonuclease I [Pseudoalteromonas tunicata]AXT31779.1 endonuclease I [Pseudoalteromonas tunicata]EAR26384.1 Endonuclease I Precursor (Endo I) [Pseudoalteromonas tunicata D2]